MPECANCGGPSAGGRYCSLCGAPLGAAAPSTARARKVVTALFTDVSGFTALGEQLDPEPLHEVIGRWLEAADRAIERHGGTVEKHMGDGVMAVFGVPVAHEDDVLRAARAALEIGEALTELNHELDRRWGVKLHVRTGLNTGEAVIGDDPTGRWSTLGDAVNVAQRLEAAAEPGQVLVGEQTAQLLRGAASLDRAAPLVLKGKAAPVNTWRLGAVAPETAELTRSAAMPFVGRTAELGFLREVFDEVVARRRPRFVTVLGPAGIGKSRLARAFVDDVSAEARPAVGRCLPYGDAITYWPLAEIVRGLAGAADEAALTSLASGGASAAEEASLISSRVARAVGFEPGGVPVEEIQWATRRLLEAVARSEPLVVVVEDIHWAAPTLLDLLEHLATFATGAPLLVICLARPELLEGRPGWASAGGERASVLRLEPFSATESGELLEQLGRDLVLTPEDQTDLLTAAEGNPFFLQQLVAMRTEAGDAPRGLPPTIQAVLTARIDRLDPGARAVLESASIEGRTFHRSAVVEPLRDTQPDELDLHLSALIRRELIRPAQPDIQGEEGFRFSHILIRDAAYALIPKQRRAGMHEQHARWLERRAARGVAENPEVTGYHFEQAFGYHVEVEPAARRSYLELARSGARYLGSAGRGALARDDLPAAISLLERAIALLPEGDPERGVLLPELGMALTESGRLRDAESLLDGAVEEAVARADGSAEAHATVARLFAGLQVDTEASAREINQRFDALRSTFERDEDDLGLDRVWRLRALVHWIGARSADADAAWERAAEHARRSGDEMGLADALVWLASSAYFGPTPVEDGIARCEAIRAQLGRDRRTQAGVLDSLAGLWAMRGEFETARRLLDERNTILAELGRTMQSAVSHPHAFVALAGGDVSAAEAVLREGYERLAEMGEKALLADTATMLARAVHEQGRHDEAWELTRVAEEAAASDDLAVQITWRTERALLLAERGAITEAKRLSAEAVRLAARTDWLSDRADALLSQAKVLTAAGESQVARGALLEAAALYERKGNMAGIQRTKALLAAKAPA
jgi:class 3 adenylate cyclase/tetratricopeptide (TPR) repeat protein